VTWVATWCLCMASNKHKPLSERKLSDDSMQLEHPARDLLLVSSASGTKKSGACT
jgi:hypothetical protein